MGKTRDSVRAEMLMYLGAAEYAMDSMKLLSGDERRGVEIIHLAGAFRQADVIERVAEAVVGIYSTTEQQTEEQKRRRQRAEY